MTEITVIETAKRVPRPARRGPFDLPGGMAGCLPALVTKRSDLPVDMELDPVERCFVVDGPCMGCPSSERFKI